MSFIDVDENDLLDSPKKYPPVSHSIYSNISCVKFIEWLFFFFFTFVENLLYYSTVKPVLSII